MAEICSHLIVCGGVKAKRLARYKRHELRVGKDKGRGEISLKVDSLTSKLVDTIPSKLYDLLKIATYVYVGDQIVPRGGNKSFDYGGRWHRRLRYVIPVKNHDFWSDVGVRDLLVETLSFASGDTFEFEFRPQKSHCEPEWLDFKGASEPEEDYNEVLLFSGGLDSFTGAVEEVVRKRTNPVLVGHTSCNQVTGLQKKLFKYIVDLKPGGMKPLHVPVEVNKKKDLTRDKCQRVRSFLYGTLGAIVARHFGKNHVRFYENGIVSCNLPFDKQGYQARNTRSTHPKLLHFMSELLSVIIGSDFSFNNPYFKMTKTEVCLRLRELKHEVMIEKTRSCAKATYVRPTTHCAVCSQCVDRRFATLASHCAAYDPMRLYRQCIFTEALETAHDRAMITGFAGFASTIEDMSIQGFVKAFSSDLMEIAKYLPVKSSENQIKMLYGLHCRQAKQVNCVIDDKIKNEAERITRGTLPDSSLLAIIGRKEHLADAKARKVDLSSGQKRSGRKEDDPKRPGRKRKYSDDQLQRLEKTVEDLLAEHMDSKGAWNSAAETHGFPSGDAARTALRRHKKNKSERN